MMKPLAFAAMLASGLVLTGCDVRGIHADRAGTNEAETPAEPETFAEEPPAEVEMPVETVEADVPEEEPALQAASVTRKATIDWDAVASDLSNAATVPPIPGASDDNFSVQNNSSGQSVPILMPTMSVRPASAEGGPSPQFRPVPDGYFAVFPGDTYNLIVNGTNEVTEVQGGQPVDPAAMKFSETTTGAIVSFSRYGADYMVEFECKGSGEEGGDCITEEEALAVANEIVISGTE